MRIEVTVPNLPESVSDATLLDWHKQPGERVHKTDTLVDLETDKVILEVPVPEAGVLREVRRSKGDVVFSGDVLAVIEVAEQGEEVVASLPAVSVGAEPDRAAIPSASVIEPSPVTGTESPSALDLSIPVSPAVRRLLLEHQINPSAIKGSGREGRLTKQDVLDHLNAQVDTKDSSPGGMSAPTPIGEGGRRVPMTRLRARIAERMLEAQRNTATLTTFNEVNLQKIFDLRNQYRSRFEQEHFTKLGFMSFFVKAVVAGLKRFPIVNASIEGHDVVYHDHYDIGIAVSTERGLVVPILRQADRLDFGEIERAVAEFSKKARDGKLSYEDLNGGTFTITNGGIFGSMLSTPILNPPQSAILGMHAIKERAVVEEGQIVIRPMIYLALSYDHRIIDGREAVSFLFAVKEVLEDPYRLLLDI